MDQSLWDQSSTDDLADVYLHLKKTTDQTSLSTSTSGESTTSNASLQQPSPPVTPDDVQRPIHFLQLAFGHHLALQEDLVAVTMHWMSLILRSWT
jgi:hypothetical protein